MKWNPIETLELKPSCVCPTEVVSEPVLLWINSNYFKGPVIGSISIHYRKDGSKYTSVNPHGFGGYEWEWDFELYRDDLACVTHWTELPKGPQE